MLKKLKPQWSEEEVDLLVKSYSHHESDDFKWEIISKEVGRSANACRGKFKESGIRLSARLRKSPYPKYDEPLVMEGDALIIPDPEFPFHHAEFINRILDLAQAWGITQCIIGGDMLHFDSLSSWNPSWTNPNGHGGLDEKQEAAFVEFAKGLGKRQQEAAFGLLETIGERPEDGDPNVSEELRVARKAVKALAECFSNVDVVLGNHEGRLLNQLKSPLFPTEITRLVDMQSWRIAPFYFQYLISGGEKYHVEHPKNYGKFSASKLCSKYLVNVLMGHSHHLSYTFDPSGKFYAIEMGCCADERRLPYASQRHNTTPSHALGAVIVRDGAPWLLHEKTDWKRMESMA